MDENYINNQNTQVGVATGPILLGVKISMGNKNCTGTPNYFPNNVEKNSETRVFYNNWTG